MPVLLEDEENADYDQRPPDAGGPLGLLLPLPLDPGELVRCLACLFFRNFHPELAECLTGIGVAFMLHEPPRGLGHAGPQRYGYEGRDRAESEDEPPVQVACVVRRGLEHDQGHQVGHENPDRDHPLLDDTQLTSPAPRRELSDIGGGDRGVRADGEPDERAGSQQHGGIDGERRQQCPDRVDRGVGDEQRLAAEVIGQRPGDERACGGAQGCSGHEVAGGEAGQMVRTNDEGQGGADVGRVVPEEEPADAGEHGQIPVEASGYARIQLVQQIPP
jgi:hypothetical protein